MSKIGVGVKGRVIDSKGNGIEASIVVKGRNFTVPGTSSNETHLFLGLHSKKLLPSLVE